jgi:hypothetical protein
LNQQIGPGLNRTVWDTLNDDRSTFHPLDRAGKRRKELKDSGRDLLSRICLGRMKGPCDYKKNDEVEKEAKTNEAVSPE